MHNYSGQDQSDYEQKDFIDSLLDDKKYSTSSDRVPSVIVTNIKNTDRKIKTSEHTSRKFRRDIIS